MPKQLLSAHPSDEPFTVERQAFLEQQADLLAEYAFFGDVNRYAALSAQLNTETSKYERGYIRGYMAARADP